ncbi:MAG: hypothetical protein H7177_02350 [Rhizobacter sp.]|nr:hypothetical protein [Bacteriovorax sp.]
MKASFVTLLLTVFLSTNAFAHRMNKPGPNNGFIRMPGTYHIELVAQKNIIKFFFLDIGFKPLPTTKATVKMALKGLTEVAVSCVKETQFFLCDMKDANMNKYSEIDVKTSKAGEKEVTSIYKIPLSF